jgi:hypothetical protein
MVHKQKRTRVKTEAVVAVLNIVYRRLIFHDSPAVLRKEKMMRRWSEGTLWRNKVISHFSFPHTHTPCYGRRDIVQDNVVVCRMVQVWMCLHRHSLNTRQRRPTVVPSQMHNREKRGEKDDEANHRTRKEARIRRSKQVSNTEQDGKVKHLQLPTPSVDSDQDGAMASGFTRSHTRTLMVLWIPRIYGRDGQLG